MDPEAPKVVAIGVAGTCKFTFCMQLHNHN
jgi:hypothetical protein